MKGGAGVGFTNVPVRYTGPTEQADAHSDNVLVSRDELNDLRNYKGRANSLQKELKQTESTAALRDAAASNAAVDADKLKRKINEMKAILAQKDEQLLDESRVVDFCDDLLKKDPPPLTTDAPASMYM